MLVDRPLRPQAAGRVAVSDGASLLKLRGAQIVGAACVVFTAFGWGLNWPATKRLLVECPPLTARGVCGLAAFLPLCGIAIFRRETLFVTRRDWTRLALASLLNVSVWMGCTTASLRWLNAGQAVTLAYTMPIWTCLLAWPLLGQRPTARQTGAILLGGFGVVVLVGAGGIHFGAGDGPGIGLALAAAVLFAFSTVYGKRFPLSAPPITLTAWQVGLGSIPLLVAGFVLEHPNLAALSPFAWFALAYTALVSMGLCYVTWFTGVRRLPPSAAAVGTLLTPVIGATASSLALGEPLTIVQLASLILVSTGILFAVRA